MPSDNLSAPPAPGRIDLRSDSASPGGDGVAFAIGHLCVSWGYLEYEVRQLLRAVAKMPDTDGVDAMLRCFDFRDQLSAIKVAAVASSLSETAIDLIVSAVDHIDNILRPRRNRVVHDLWIQTPDFEVAYRVETQPRIHRPQAHMPRQIRDNQTQEHWQDIANSRWEVVAYGDYVSRLARYIDAPTDDALRALLAEPPQPPQYLRPQETPRPTDTREPTQPPPPQSSEG